MTSELVAEEACNVIITSRHINFHFKMASLSIEAEQLRFTVVERPLCGDVVMHDNNNNNNNSNNNNKNSNNSHQSTKNNKNNKNKNNKNGPSLQFTLKDVQEERIKWETFDQFLLLLLLLLILFLLSLLLLLLLLFSLLLC